MSPELRDESNGQSHDQASIVTKLLRVLPT